MYDESHDFHIPASCTIHSMIHALHAVHVFGIESLLNDLQRKRFQLSTTMICTFDSVWYVVVLYASFWSPHVEFLPLTNLRFEYMYSICSLYPGFSIRWGSTIMALAGQSSFVSAQWTMIHKAKKKKKRTHVCVSCFSLEILGMVGR